MITAVELGLIYAIMALGVYLTFRILDFPDLTVDGSFTTGAATASILIVNGTDPYLATAVSFFVGALAGVITGLLHTKGNIDGLLAGILTMIALYSINLRIMGKANVPLLGEDTVLSPLRDNGLLGTWPSVGLLFVGCLVAVAIIVWFLHTDLGMAMRATGDNPEMIRSLGVSTDNQKILGLAISNGLVALSGAFIAQYQGFADIGMGIGLILIGLASVIVGQAIFSQRYIWLAALAVVFGAVIYRVVIQFALNAGLEVNDMKLISAILVVLALVLPQMKAFGALGRRLRITSRGARDTDPDPAVEPEPKEAQNA
ncbi:ABC transporter permease [Zhihengliuella sp.]|uniref:ABC transporter permease n=1 Tax=Zhihengliuella sp. TaxID=1954483 RepID=UPI002812269E|nr:ABC transporter permease [Zhihengliuella sp.]